MFRSLLLATLALAVTGVLAKDPAAEATGHAGHSAEHRAQREARHAEHRAKAEARFAAADKSGDGKLDRAEATAMHERLGDHFDRVDGNKDSLLDRDELRAAHQHRRQRAQHGRGHQMVRRAYLRGLMIGMDDDRDQALTRAEIGDKAPRLARDFATLDADKDGKLTRSELRPGHRHGQ